MQPSTKKSPLPCGETLPNPRVNTDGRTMNPHTQYHRVGREAYSENRVRLPHNYHSSAAGCNGQSSNFLESYPGYGYRTPQNSRPLHLSPPYPSFDRSSHIPHQNSELGFNLRHYPSVPCLNQRSYYTMPNYTQDYVGPAIQQPLDHYGNHLPSFNELHQYTDSPEMASAHYCAETPELSNDYSEKYCASSTNDIINVDDSPKYEGPHENCTLSMLDIMRAEKNQQLKSFQHQLSTTHEYYKSLPSLDEYRKVEAKLAKVEESKSLALAKVKQLQLTLDYVSHNLKLKESHLSIMEQQRDFYKDKFETLQNELQDLRPGNVDEKETNNALLRVNLLAEVKSLKKQLEKQQNSINQAKSKYQTDVKHLREELEYEKNLRLAVKVELEYREETLTSFKVQLKDAEAKKQRVMEDNLGLQEKVKRLSVTSCDAEERYTLEKRLFRELKICHAEIEDITKVVKDHLEGEDPNVSLFVGRPALCSESIYDLTNRSIVIEIEEARSMKESLAKIREDIADCYAEYLGSKLQCPTQ